MTLPTSRATRNETHASNLAYALRNLMDAQGMDDQPSHIFGAWNDALKALRAYSIDNPAFR